MDLKAAKEYRIHTERCSENPTLHGDPVTTYNSAMSSLENIRNMFKHLPHDKTPDLHYELSLNFTLALIESSIAGDTAMRHIVESGEETFVKLVDDAKRVLYNGFTDRTCDEFLTAVNKVKEFNSSMRVKVRNIEFGAPNKNMKNIVSMRFYGLVDLSDLKGPKEEWQSDLAKVGPRHTELKRMHEYTISGIEIAFRDYSEEIESFGILVDLCDNYMVDFRNGNIARRIAATRSSTVRGTTKFTSPLKPRRDVGGRRSRSSHTGSRRRQGSTKKTKYNKSKKYRNSYI